MSQEEYLIVGDIHGQWQAFQRLIAHYPDVAVLSVGDLCDRGPDSYSVMKFFRDSVRGDIALLGNHDLMCLEYLKRPKFGFLQQWARNGGYETLDSFNRNGVTLEDDEIMLGWVNWLSGLKIAKVLGNEAIVSHTFNDIRSDEEDMWRLLQMTGSDLVFGDYQYLVWNRDLPVETDLLQIAGHNSHFGLKEFLDKDDKCYAICLDDSRKQLLTGLHWPSMKIIQEPF